MQTCQTPLRYVGKLFFSFLFYYIYRRKSLKQMLKLILLPVPGNVCGNSPVVCRSLGVVCISVETPVVMSPEVEDSREVETFSCTSTCHNVTMASMI